MNIKVRVKTLKEIKERYGDIGVVSSMEKYCGKIIELEYWNGKVGTYKSYKWTLLMLSEINVKEHNRNGANS